MKNQKYEEIFKKKDILKKLQIIIIYSQIINCFLKGNNYNNFSYNNLNGKLLFFIDIESNQLFDSVKRNRLTNNIQKNFNIKENNFCFIGSDKNKDTHYGAKNRSVLVLFQYDRNILNKINEISCNFAIFSFENINDKNIMFSVL